MRIISLYRETQPDTYIAVIEKDNGDIIEYGVIPGDTFGMANEVRALVDEWVNSDQLIVENGVVDE